MDQLLKTYEGKADEAVLLNLISAFQVGRKGRPLSSLEELGELMQVTEHPLFRRPHWSRRGADDLTDAIDSVLRRVTRDQVQSARFLSATLDEVTTANGQGRMSIHLYWSSGWTRQHAFIAMPRIEGAPNAETLFNLLVTTLEKYVGLYAKELARKLVQLACDGASVLQGAETGLAVRLLAVAPFLVIMHCHAHRLDLVAGSIKTDAAFALATSMSTAPTAYYARSTKRLEALKDVRAHDLVF